MVVNLKEKKTLVNPSMLANLEENSSVSSFMSYSINIFKTVLFSDDSNNFASYNLKSDKEAKETDLNESTEIDEGENDMNKSEEVDKVDSLDTDAAESRGVKRPASSPLHDVEDQSLDHHKKIKTEIVTDDNVSVADNSSKVIGYLFTTNKQSNTMFIFVSIN